MSQYNENLGNQCPLCSRIITSVIADFTNDDLFQFTPCNHQVCGKDIGLLSSYLIFNIQVGNLVNLIGNRKSKEDNSYDYGDKFMKYLTLWFFIFLVIGISAFICGLLGHELACQILGIVTVIWVFGIPIGAGCIYGNPDACRGY